MWKVRLVEDDAPTGDALDLAEYESDYVPTFASDALAREFAERRFAEENRDYGYEAVFGIMWATPTYGAATVRATPESWAEVVPVNERHHEMNVVYLIVPA